MVKTTIRAAAIGVALLTGCQSDREKARDVAEEFATDLREKRGDPCELLESYLEDELARKPPRSWTWRSRRRRCDARARKEYAAKIGQGKVTVRVCEDSVKRAQARVGDVRLSLNEGYGEGWTIDTISVTSHGFTCVSVR